MGPDPVAYLVSGPVQKVERVIFKQFIHCELDVPEQLGIARARGSGGRGRSGALRGSARDVTNAPSAKRTQRHGGGDAHEQRTPEEQQDEREQRTGAHGGSLGASTGFRQTLHRRPLCRIVNGGERGF